MNYTKALVVDDSRVARITLKKKLEQYGLAVDMAESAQEAIDYLHRTPVDIIFMDYMMPEVDGLEATRRIKADAAIPNVPVIICSGKEDDDYSDLARSLGASEIIAKPPANEVLEAILRATPAMLLGGAAPAAAVVAEVAAAAAAAPAAAVGAVAIPGMDAGALRALLEDLLAPRLREYREELHKELHDVQASVMEEIAVSFEQRVAGVHQRLDEIVAQPAPRGPDMGEIMTALEERLTRQSGELQRRLEAQLQSYSPVHLVEELQERLRADMQEQRKQMTESLDQWAERIDGMAARLREIADDSSASESASVSRFDVLQQRLSDVEAAQAAAPARDIDAAFASLEQKLEQRLAELRDGFAVQLEQQSPAPLIAGLQEQLRAGLESEQGRLQQSNEQWSARFDALARDVGQLSESASSAAAHSGERLDLLQERLSALESAAPAPVVDAILAAAEKKFAERTTELQARFQSQLESQSPVLTRIQGQIDDQGQRFREASEQWGTRVESLVQDVSVLSDAVSSFDVAQERRFSAVQQRIAALENAAPAPVVDAILAAAEDKFALRITDLQSDLQARLEAQAPAPLVDQLRDELQRRLEDQHGRLMSSLAEHAQRLGSLAQKADEFAAADAQAQNAQDQQISALREWLGTLAQEELPGVRDAIAAMETQLSQRIADLQAEFQSGVQELKESQRAELSDSRQQMAERFDALKDDNRATLTADTERFADTLHEELEERILQARADITAELQLQFGNQLRRLHSGGREGAEGAVDMSALLAQAEKRSAELLPQIDKALGELREQLNAQPALLELQSRRLLDEVAARAKPADDGLQARLNRVAIFAGIGVVVSLAVAIMAYLS
jgi:CheY-like chemotaxis protein